MNKYHPLADRRAWTFEQAQLGQLASQQGSTQTTNTPNPNSFESTPLEWTTPPTPFRPEPPYDTKGSSRAMPEVEMSPLLLPLCCR